MSIKGARALIKVYTDLQAAVEDVQSWFSIGLEPVIGLVSLLCFLEVPGQDSIAGVSWHESMLSQLLSRAIEMRSHVAMQSLQRCNKC